MELSKSEHLHIQIKGNTNNETDDLLLDISSNNKDTTSENNYSKLIAWSLEN